ncbi:hypothetical protein [Nitrosophilus alvini]|uniref:hypothetical protein n=1 Tax=Nitrosophilus alvini TaxID=2714855 RepID=UPI00190C6601|nr:hypothetical protein [Nitrosophilus alvini]
MKIFFKVLLVIDFMVIIFCLINNNFIWMLNTQVALLGSLAVSFGTYISYKKVVEEKSKEHIVADNRDVLEKIEDPYFVYDEESESEGIDEKTFKEIVVEEKKKLKSPKTALKNFVLTSKGFLSIYRIAAYAFLAVTLLMLIDRKVLDIFSYLVGLSIVPVSALITSFVSGKKIGGENQSL